MNPNQWGVISLIASALVLEGLDIQIMSFAAPAIARDWQVSAPAMGPVIGAALIGTLVGGAFGGYVGDRLGRRPTLIASVVFFATFTALAALSTDVTMLTFLRFIAGLGFGAALPAATALAA